MYAVGTRNVVANNVNVNQNPDRYAIDDHSANSKPSASLTGLFLFQNVLLLAENKYILVRQYKYY